MTPIPVICDSCHQLWLADHVVGVDAGSKAEIAFKNVGVSPCPYCGGAGRIPDGVYELTRDVARLVASLSRNDLGRLQQILSGARERAASDEEVEADIEREVPAALDLMQLLKAKQQSLAGWLGVLLALITVLMQAGVVPAHGEDQPSTVTPEQVEEIIVRVEQRLQSGPRTIPREQPKVGRNDPCPCGSGKKFKHCHGR